jgi:hypothetical protein
VIVRAVAANGQLGTGFRTESLRAAARGAAFIGCDAGSVDPGPYYLGAGVTHASDRAVANDIERMLQVAHEESIPVVIGTAGTAGARPHLDGLAEIVRRCAKKLGAPLRLATISSDVDAATVRTAISAGRVNPLGNHAPLTADEANGALRFVAAMGVEPFQAALEAGADIVLAGRATDAAIYAAPLMRAGIPAAVAWHAGKILECGAACAEQRLRPDSMAVDADAAGFVVVPPNPEMTCSPASVSAHSLYENADPFWLVEPGGAVDTAGCRYLLDASGNVRVEGSRFVPADRYTVKLEGVRLTGYRTVVLGAINDPVVLGQLDEFLSGVDAVVTDKVGDSLGLSPGSYHLAWRRLGASSQSVGLVIEVVADTQGTAADIASIAWHTALHHPVGAYSGLGNHIAFPFSPPSIDAGPVYEFCANHTITLDDPCALFPITYEEL